LHTRRFHVDQGSDLYFDSTILYTSEELRPQEAPVYRSSSRVQPPVLPPDVSIQLRTPTRQHDPGSNYPFIAQQVHQSPHTAQFTHSPAGAGQHHYPYLGTPGSVGHGGLPPHFQQQHGLPPGYANSPATFMSGRQGPQGPHAMNGMINGIPTQNFMQFAGMNGHTASPSPARTAFPGGGGARGLPPGMNLYPS
jgi:hypothetical protein